MSKQLKNGVPFGVTRGFHNIKMVMATPGTGSGKLQMQVADEAYTDVPESQAATDLSYNIFVPSCRLMAVLADDARCYVTRIQ